MLSSWKDCDRGEVKGDGEDGGTVDKGGGFSRARRRLEFDASLVAIIQIINNKRNKMISNVRNYFDFFVRS